MMALAKRGLAALLTLTWVWVMVGCNENSFSRQFGDESAPRKKVRRAAPEPWIGAGSKGKPGSLLEARENFQTTLLRREQAGEPVPEPPAKIFQLVQYDSEVGKLAAYLTPNPNDGRKHPAIIWITGGDCNTIGDVWEDAPRDNDQTASAYRKADIVMMFPSLRGGNQNPGFREGFYGEVNDVIYASRYLSKLEYVDKTRIYLGGHSTGGTLAMLTAASTDRFRAVFSFGPIERISNYGNEFTPFNRGNPQEQKLRDPVQWLNAIQCRLFVIEGSLRPGNIKSWRVMADQPHSNNIVFVPVSTANHFSVLAPSNEVIAEKILLDTGPQTNITLTEQELQQAISRR